MQLLYKRVPPPPTEHANVTVKISNYSKKLFSLHKITAKLRGGMKMTIATTYRGPNNDKRQEILYNK